ncbi:cytochrome P450 4c21-like [Brevipalpus obovatus]|uniref:cytochrome P450 4c21-like n=1 Tax=Brevipalpus obovatus TaxID=246614 RepID=UPI003D9E7BEA
MDSPPIIRDLYHFSMIRHSPGKLHQSQFKETGWFILWASYYPLLTVFKPKPAHAIMSNTKFLSRGWAVQAACQKYENLLSLSGQRWKDRKVMIAPSFSLDVIQSFLPTVTQHAEYLIEDIKMRIEMSFDFHHLIADHTMSISLDTSIGLEKSSNWPGKTIIHNGLKKWIASQIERIGKPYLWFEMVNNIHELIRGNKNLMDDCKSQIDQVIKARIEANTLSDGHEYFDDGKVERKPFLAHMVSEFVNQSKKKKSDFNYDQLLLETIAIIVTSYETIASTVRWTLFNLAGNLDIQQRLYQELSSYDSSQNMTIRYLDSFEYLDQCLSESLRLSPPISSIVRQIEHNITLDGFDIPKDTLSLISVTAIHHDETIYPSPEVFNPDRFSPENRDKIPPGAFIPFGEGPRKCIGWKLALVVSKILIAHIVKHCIVHVEDHEKVKVRNDLLLVPEKPIMFRFSLRS